MAIPKNWTGAEEDIFVNEYNRLFLEDGENKRGFNKRAERAQRVLPEERRLKFCNRHAFLNVLPRLTGEDGSITNRSLRPSSASIEKQIQDTGLFAVLPLESDEFKNEVTIDSVLTDVVYRNLEARIDRIVARATCKDNLDTLIEASIQRLFVDTSVTGNPDYAPVIPETPVVTPESHESPKPKREFRKRFGMSIRNVPVERAPMQGVAI